MNKYLLLRDNKQSGPYTTDELIAKGIKPYDLVWIEGKSAAWRYPSEVDELQLFAPAVEEQPYDRFFSKTDRRHAAASDESDSPTVGVGRSSAVSVGIPSDSTDARNNRSSDNRSVSNGAGNTRSHGPRAVPNRSGQTTSAPASHAVYVKFPVTAVANNELSGATLLQSEGAPTSDTTDASKQNIIQEAIPPQSTKTPSSQTDATMRNTVPQELAPPEEGNFAPQQPTEEFAFIPTAPVSRKGRFSEMRLSRVAIIAGFAMLMFISFLIINYRSERHRIDALHATMQQLEAQEEEPVGNDAALPPVSPAPDPDADVSHTEATLPADARPERPQAARVSTGSLSSTPGHPARVNKTTAATTNTSKNADGGSTKTDVSASGPSAGVPTAQPASAPASRPGGENLYELVEITANEYKTGVLGGISDLRLELSNHSQRELHRVFVELRYLGPEKKVVRTRTVYFENVAPGGRSVVEVPKSNRGVTVDYLVTNIKS